MFDINKVIYTIYICLLVVLCIYCGRLAEKDAFKERANNYGLTQYSAKHNKMIPKEEYYDMLIYLKTGKTDGKW